MQNISMNRKITGVVIRMMLLVCGALGILLTSLFLVSCGGEEDDPAASVSANPLTDDPAASVSANPHSRRRVPLPEVPKPPEPPPSPEPPLNPQPGEQMPQPPVQQQPQPEPLPEPPLNDLGACAVGMKLKPRESCSYVAGRANVVFSVRQDGSACREGGPVNKVEVIFGAQVNVNIKNQNICRNNDIERDDAFNSNFAANKNPDGSWTVNSLP